MADANSAAKPVEIRVAQGIYTPDINSAVSDGTGVREATFQLINGVILKGGFAGVGELDPDVRDVNAYETILSGDLNGDDVEVAKPIDLMEEPTRAENSYHVVTGSSTDQTAVLDGFTITGGNPDGPILGKHPYGYRLRHGGGMYNYEGSPTLTNCTFRGNSAKYGGGGGMCNMENSSPTLTNCIFSGNPAHHGGGMVNYQSSPTLTNCTFSGNSTQSRGGGMVNVQSSPTLTNCTFSGNSAQLRGGGGMHNERESSPTLMNCTFAQNSAENGSALACDRYLTDLPEPSNVELINCILWDGGNEIWNNDNSTIIATYSNIQGGFPGEGNIDTDPLFVDLGYWDPNGTPADESDDYWVNGDYHLRSQAGRWDPASESWVIDSVTSPCIDAGDPNSPVAFEPFRNGARVNMGAYSGTAEASKSPSGLHARYGGGTGEPHDPYLIYTAEHLNALGAEPNDYDNHFKLMADIDLSGYSYDRAVIAPDTNDVENWFQGIPFTGVFDGNCHTISHLTITGDLDRYYYVGMFGQVAFDAELKNLGVADVNIIMGGRYIGGLIGGNSGAVTQCSSTGAVSGDTHVGGLVGGSSGTITTSYSTAAVSGVFLLGGLVGESSGSITASYSSGDVSGDENLGGLVGVNSGGNITTSYSTGTVIGDDAAVGGLVGQNISGSILGCYSIGDVGGWRAGRME